MKEIRKPINYCLNCPLCNNQTMGNFCKYYQTQLKFNDVSMPNGVMIKPNWCKVKALVVEEEE